MSRNEGCRPDTSVAGSRLCSLCGTVTRSGEFLLRAKNVPIRRRHTAFLLPHANHSSYSWFQKTCHPGRIKINFIESVPAFPCTFNERDTDYNTSLYLSFCYGITSVWIERGLRLLAIC